jgi:hypothetical protein
MKTCLRFAGVVAVFGLVLSMLSIPQSDAASWNSVRKPSGAGAKGYIPPTPTTPKKPKGKG